MPKSGIDSFHEGTVRLASLVTTHLREDLREDGWPADLIPRIVVKVDPQTYEMYPDVTDSSYVETAQLFEYGKNGQYGFHTIGTFFTDADLNEDLARMVDEYYGELVEFVEGLFA